MKKKSIILFAFIFFVLVVLSANSINDTSEVNKFDRLVMKPYSKPLDDTATILNYISIASPALLAINRNGGDIATLGVMYLETMAGAYASKEILKKVIDRPRPYTYFEGAPENEMEDWNDSFPSGHTTLAFASAGFTSYVFSHYYPDSKWRVPVIATSYTLAAATAALRIMSGNHFMSDVIAGALLGTIWGIGIPMLHTFGDNVKMGVTPFALAFSISL